MEGRKESQHQGGKEGSIFRGEPCKLRMTVGNEQEKRCSN